MAKAKRVHSTPRRTASKIQTKKLAKVKKMDGIETKRAKAYSDMESHVCDLASMGEIAAMMFDKGEGLFIFATTKLEEMLHQFKTRYYAEDFPR